MCTKLIYCLIFLLSGYGCMSPRTIENLKNNQSKGDIELIDIEHISTGDKIMGCLLAAGAGGSFRTQYDFSQSSSQPPNAAVQAGILATYASAGRFDFDMNILKQFYVFEESDSGNDLEDQGKSISWNFGANCMIPIYSFDRIKEGAMVLNDSRQGDTYHYVITECKNKSSVGIQVGFNHNFVYFNENYAIVPILDPQEALNFPNGVASSNLEVRQGIYSGKIGVAFSLTSLTSFLSKHSKFNSGGGLSRHLKASIDVLYPIGIQSDPFRKELRYYISSQDNYELVQDFTVADVYQKNRLGLSTKLIYEGYSSVENKASLIYSLSMELGILPGYFPSLSERTMLRINLGFGIGKYRRKSN